MPMSSPFRVDARGRTATPTAEEQLRALIEATLLTAPGERPNRPGFGSALGQLVFAPASDEIALATRHLIQSALVGQLGDRVQVERVDARAVDEVLTVTVVWRSRSDGVLRTTTLQRGR